VFVYALACSLSTARSGSVSKPFRTATRSPKCNFDFLFLQKIIIKN
jgi:hypothetical protein